MYATTPGLRGPLLLLIGFLVDLYLLIQLGSVIGALNAVILVVFSAVLGVQLVRHQGLATLREAQLRMAQGETPERSMVEGLMVLLGGTLLMLPGPLSDGVGLLMMIPPIRRAVAAWVVKRIFWFFPPGPPPSGGGGRLIEGDYRREE